MCVITAYRVRCLGCWLLEVKCRAAGYASEMKDVAAATHTYSLELLMMGIGVPETC